MADACKNCRWYWQAPTNTHGYCKLDPPVFTHVEEGTQRPMFFNPVVGPNNHCSHFEADK
jgi:hypothetical protein